MRMFGFTMLSLAVLLGCGSTVPAWEDPTQPAERLNEAWWKDRHEIKKPLRNFRVAFLGDSITQGWEGTGAAAWNEMLSKYNPANFGYSGDRTAHVIWRLEQGELLPAKPELVVMMIGTNNIGHRTNTPAETVNGIKAILAKIKKESPKTKVLLLAVFPRDPAPDGEFRKQVVAINAELVKIKDPNVIYRDYGDSFLGANGALRMDIMPDALHLNEAGYKIWAERLVKDLGAILK